MDAATIFALVFLFPYLLLLLWIAWRAWRGTSRTSPGQRPEGDSAGDSFGWGGG